MATRASTAASPSDEIFFSNSGVSLCLLVNRRARAMRVIDFRSGPSPTKRIFVMSLARREGVERVYTLVERDECGTWAKMGFTREGNIPGFYKRSDAFVLGAIVPPNEGSDDLEQSGLRPVFSENTEDTETERLYQHTRKVAKDRENLPPLVAKVQPARDPDLQKAITAAVKSGRA